MGSPPRRDRGHARALAREPEKVGTLIEYAVAHARGVGTMLFLPWGNVRRDLALACDKVGIEPCSPNDLRHTCATWLRQDGPPDLIAPLMGHADTRMVERVYGR